MALAGFKKGKNGYIHQEDYAEKLRPRTEEELRAIQEEEERGHVPIIPRVSSSHLVLP